MSLSSQSCTSCCLSPDSIDQTIDIWHSAVVLEGKWVRLEPYGSNHAHGVYTAFSKESSTFQYFPPPFDKGFESVEDTDEQQKKLLRMGELLFVVVNKSSNLVVGVYSLFNLNKEHLSLELGVWLSKDVRGTKVNLETTFLLLCHAFDRLKCIRVVWKTDMRNVVSQKAAQKAGAVYEGVLRNHIIMSDGYKRSSVYFSWLDYEFEPVRAMLKKNLYDIN